MKKNICILSIFVFCSTNLFAQGIKEVEKYSSLPKNTKEFAVDYKIALPRLEGEAWNDDYNSYTKYLTSEVRKTQIWVGIGVDSLKKNFMANSATPHAQLDTNTMIKKYQDVIGVWRMVKFRALVFIDSAILPNGKCYRIPAEIIADNSKDDAFMIFTEKKSSLYVKQASQNKFEKNSSTKYKMSNPRFMMTYKLFKSKSSISQVGIDENGYLIINRPMVEEKEVTGKFITYSTRIDQYILEKMK